MRHGKKVNHLGRKSAHRKAMLSNMACSLIEHKRISTTLAKAKALRKYIEPLVTKAKDDSTHSRRMAFRKLQSKEAVKELFGSVSQKVGDRPGGYTRILRTGFRLGDNAEMCIIELVDFNEAMLKSAASSSGKKATRRKRTRRGGRKESDAANNQATADSSVEEATVVEETLTEATNVVEETTTDLADAAENVVEETTTEITDAVDDIVDEATDNADNNTDEDA